MRVGIYQDLRDPPQWRRGWSRGAGAALERAEEAERLGLDSAWSTEHHFFADGYLPQPLLWAAAVAARTTRIRIGTAVVLAPLHAPIEIAEQATLVDQISGGRLELGLGAGYVKREFAAFGASRKNRFQLTEACVTELRRMLQEGIVTPGPFQDELPIWLGVHGPYGARIAGRNRTGLLWLDASLLEPFRRGLSEGGHDPDAAVMGGLASLIITRDPERTWSLVKPHLKYQWASYAQAAAVGGSDSGLVMLDRGSAVERNPGPVMLPPGYDAVTPEEAVRRIRSWLGGLPVSDIFFFDSIAAMPEEIIHEHITLLASEVAPHLAERDG
jgi:alkanesulfonate monooxygenase SsuD/methylene tetrahydromethanopterin reductase-like flavin-dependent oxidoreductase (luciferase family)